MRTPAAAAVFLVGLASGAFAQTAPNVLFAGQVAPAVGATQFGGSCYVGRGFSTFQRGAGTKAVISFDEIFDSARWDLRGQAVMTFATATNGDIRFKQTTGVPAAIRDPQFSNYSESYDPAARRLVVQFVIQFPDCALPIVAVYDHT